VIDWYSVLQRMSDIPERDKKLAETLQILRARLDLRGTKLAFSDERGDYWWWLMTNSDVNAARLVLAAMNTQAGTSGISEWLQDMPRLVNGLIARQHKGAWMTTTANVWGTLAVEKYASNFERDTVTGTTSISIQDERNQPFTQNSIWQSAPGADNAAAAAKPPTVTLPWAAGPASLNITHQGTGKPYVVLQSLAAVPLTKEDFAGYRLTRTVTPVTQKVAGKWSVGDVYRVKIDIDAQAEMAWVVVSDPVPAGATVLGSGLARGSQIDTRNERGSSGGWAAFEERTFEGFRVYYNYLSKGASSVEYTVRLNQPGNFALPATRAEAMYAPDMYGAVPNTRMKVE
jgi:alpha-2-macroglobulin